MTQTRPLRGARELCRRVMAVQFVRFLFVGLVNSLFGYGCFAGFLAIGLHYAVALFLATVIGVLFNFKTTGALVFRSSSNRLLFRFCAVYGIVYTANVLLMKCLLRVGLNSYASGAVLLAPIAVLSYILNKKYVFQHGKIHQHRYPVL